MGADTKKLRTRMKSVNSTLHLTKAMGLVASSKIRRANDAMLKGREYSDAVKNIIDLLTGCPECSKNPYLRNDSGKVCLIVIAGDRGLAGGYNANVFRLASSVNADMVIPIGKRACERYGNGYYSAEKFSFTDADELAKRLCAEFVEGKFDKLGIITTEYQSVLSQVAVLRWALPLIPNKNAPKINGAVFEPNEKNVLETAVPQYLAGIISGAARESFACEVAARRNAMDSAEKNARQMIDDLQIAYNRARQGAITQEITEIVAGSGN